MALPTDVTGGVGGGDYFKPALGQNKILIVGDAVIGYEYWTAEEKPVRSKTKFDEPLDNPKVSQVKNPKTGETESKIDGQKFFWAMPVYDFKDETFKLWQVMQKGVKESLASYQKNPEWGNPVGNYTLSIDRSGEGFTTKYNVVANPVKDKKALDAIMAKYATNTIDVDKALFS
jgi:hypothetical protein